MRLLKAPSAIRVGAVLRRAETNFRLVKCFDASTDTCTLTPTCRLRKVLCNALTADFAELDGVTLADIAGPRRTLGKRNAVVDGLKAQG